MTLPNKEKAGPDVLEKILISKCIETAQGYIEQPPLLLDHFTIFQIVLICHFHMAHYLAATVQKRLLL